MNLVVCLFSTVCHLAMSQFSPSKYATLLGVRLMNSEGAYDDSAASQQHRVLSSVRIRAENRVLAGFAGCWYARGACSSKPTIFIWKAHSNLIGRAPSG
mmetsp:Transcript_34892/g.86790  ORF Transcript_34892/g.86790 Transcript_34892/m.86790 type:complete len:99 (+) Transcript_34892:32-328(+)